MSDFDYGVKVGIIGSSTVVMLGIIICICYLDLTQDNKNITCVTTNNTKVCTIVEKKSDKNIREAVYKLESEKKTESTL